MRFTLRSLLPLLILLPGLAQAAPDPMSAGRALQRVVVEVGTGDVRVTISKTEHLKIDGKERDVRRDGKVAKIRRAVEDVALTVPEHVTLEIAAGTGDVQVTGAAKALLVKGGAGDVRIRGQAGKIDVRTGTGSVQLHLRLADGADVDVKSGSGDLALELEGGAKPQLDLRSKSGKVSGADRHAPEGKAKIRLVSASGDVAVR